jgi:sec-independent protein translocase protein TatC
MSHLLELRDRLMKAMLALLISVHSLRDLRQRLFTLIAQPLLAKLPEARR